MQSVASIHPDVFPVYVLPTYMSPSVQPMQLGTPSLLTEMKTHGLLSYMNNSLSVPGCSLYLYILTLALYLSAYLEN